MSVQYYHYFGFPQSSNFPLPRKLQDPLVRVSRGSSESLVIWQGQEGEVTKEHRLYGEGFSMQAITLTDMLLASANARAFRYETLIGGRLQEVELYSPSLPVWQLADVKGGYAPDRLMALKKFYSGNDVYAGFPGPLEPNSKRNDQFSGYSGDDVFTGYGDDGVIGDLFYGGNGIDTAVYRQSSSNYDIRESFTVWDPVNESASRWGIVIRDLSGLDGKDQLVDVELLRFPDVTLDLRQYVPSHVESHRWGSEYVLVKSSGWEDARVKALEMGGDLVVIDSLEEQEFIQETFSERLWIGLRSVFDDEVYTWVDGQPLTYTNWQNGVTPEAWRPQYVGMQIDAGDLGGTYGTWDTYDNDNGSYRYGLVEFKVVIGTNEPDFLVGSPKSERIASKAGDDGIIGSIGDDIIDGGSGVDSVRYPLSLAQVSFFRSSDVEVVLQATSWSDRLINVERVVLSGGSVALDLDGNAGVAATMIVTAFGTDHLRTLGSIGVGLVDKGATADDLAEMIVQNRLLPTRTNAEFVSHVVKNLMGRNPTQSESRALLDQIDSGILTQASFLVSASKTDHAVNLVGTLLLDGVALPLS